MVGSKKNLAAFLSNRSTGGVKYVASIGNQFAFIASQGLVLLCLYRGLGAVGLDEVFLALALVTPLYVLLLLGGRQLYASEVLNSSAFLRMRIAAGGCFIILALSVWALFARELVSLHMLILVVTWKVHDMSQDMVGIFLQKANAVTGLLALSVVRVLLILPAFLFYGESSIYALVALLSLSPLVIFCLLYTKLSAVNGKVTLLIAIRGLGLGAAAASSAMTVAMPRLMLGTAVGLGTGVLAFIGVASYVYLVGQIVITALAPYAIAIVLKYSLQARVRKIRQVVRLSGILYFIAVLMISGMYLFLIRHHSYLSDFKGLFFAILIFIYIGLLGNTTEAFVSTVGAERVAVVAAMGALLTSVILSSLLIQHFGAYGYCAGLAGAFTVRLCLLHLGLSKRVGGGSRDAA